MKEIEIKVKVDDLKKCIDIFKEKGCDFTDPIHQHDTAYFPKDFAHDELHRLGFNFLRIRRENNRTTFTLKQPQTNQLDCVEHELGIDDPKEMEHIIKMLDYVPYVDIKKKRRTGTLDEYEICLDEVEGLGNFIEVEKITDEEADVVQKTMTDWLRSIGIDGENICQGYDILIKRALEN